MALHIRNPEADRLARELAARTGETLTEAVVHSLEERLRRIRKPDAQMVADLMEIAARSAALPVLNDLTDDEILGYGPNGYPE